MPASIESTPRLRPTSAIPTIWLFAFGYFAAYVPYSSLTKAVSNGLFEGSPKVSGFSMLPLSVTTSVVGMYIFLGFTRWYKYASHTNIAGLAIPHPGPWTLLSGLCTALIIATTTLAYTFEGVSIVFIMLLMRGGVLVLAPIVDSISGRKTRWFSWAGLVFSILALVVAYSEKRGTDITVLCAIDVAVYVGSYFVRLQLMTRLAKSTDPHANRRFFVEEQLVATPAVLLGLITVALIGGQGEIPTLIRWGFLEVWSTQVWPWMILIGFGSMSIFIFGSLVLLDKSENTFSVPVNRSSSIIAGVAASCVLWVVFEQSAPSTYKLGGAALILCAILFLAIPPLLEKRSLRGD